MPAWKDPKTGLTIKQEGFVRHFILTGNADESYREAYDCDNMQDDTIRRQAHEVLHMQSVQNGIAREKAKIATKLGITVDYITERLERIAEKAENLDQLGVARATMVDISKLHGIYIEKQDRNITAKITDTTLDNVDDATIRQALRLIESGITQESEEGAGVTQSE